MWPYWMMLLLPLAGVAGNARSQLGRYSWYLVIFLFALMVGLRYEVGGDWGSYLRHFDFILYYDFSEVLGRGDPGYYGINWIVADNGGSILWVNLVCAFIAIGGLHYFCRNQPLPWLALYVAVPYLIIVVCMGYSRQAAALGFALIGLTALGKHQLKQFVFWVILGALFHKTAVLLIPIAALSSSKNKFWNFIWVGIMAAAAAYVLIVDDVDHLIGAYIEDDYAFASQGAQIRVFMNVVPAVLLLLFHKRLFYDKAERKLWVILALISLVCIPALSYSATAVDRMALYLLPIQLFVFSRLPFIAKNRANYNFIIFGVVAYYALVQFVWLNFGHHARFWLPYQSYLFS
ncbi:MAG: EpsG family protein [Pseudomonadales bacterium]